MKPDTMPDPQVMDMEPMAAQNPGIDRSMEADHSSTIHTHRPEATDTGMTASAIKSNPPLGSQFSVRPHPPTAPPQVRDLQPPSTQNPGTV